jgi:hypothetical protein
MKPSATRVIGLQLLVYAEKTTFDISAASSQCVQALCRLYSGSIEALLRLYPGSIQALFKLYSSSTQALLKLY